jgi:hypothetical protein
MELANHHPLNKCARPVPFLLRLLLAQKRTSLIAFSTSCGLTLPGGGGGGLLLYSAGPYFTVGN